MKAKKKKKMTGSKSKINAAEIKRETQKEITAIFS